MAVEELPVAIVGAGPVGLTLAIRLAQHGVASVLFDAQPDHEAAGSRAICMQRETLEIWGRAGVGERVARRGVQWHIGRTYFGNRELFSVELPAATHDHFPPFVNISQSEVESSLIDRCREAGVDLRRGWRLTGLDQDADGVDASFETDAGARTVRAAWLVGTDGAHSAARHALGLEFRGYSFDDRFLICDIRARLPFPNERRFFFDPPHNRGRQVLIHPQPDDVWRIDWQVPSETDLDDELRSRRLDARIRAVIGGGVDYELVWATAYRFSQRVVDRFGVGRAFLAGDAAHLMSPFGARGLNSGVADAENLSWKLALVCQGDAPRSLLGSYDAERRPAALENLAVTDATMRFMVPHGPLRRAWRDLVLRLSTRSAWFRARVNSGRLAQPFSYAGSPIVAPGPEDPSLPRHGEVAPDVPLPDGRLRDLLGDGFVVLLAGPAPAPAPPSASVPPAASVVAPDDPTGALAGTYAPRGPRGWIIRPDGHLADSAPLAAPADLEGLLARLPRAMGR